MGLKFKLGYDDSLDVVGVHLVGGLVGALLTGVFADVAINELGANGLVNGGGFALLGKQVVGIGATLAFSFIGTLGILKVIQLTIGLRVTEEDELTGVDLAQHSEVGYALSEGGSHTSAPSAAPVASHAPAPIGAPRGSEA